MYVVAEISTRPRCKTLGTMRGNTTHRLSGRLCSRIIATLCSAHNQKIREQIDTLASNNRSNTMKKRRSLFPGSFRVIQSPRHIDSRTPDRHTTLTTCMRLFPTTNTTAATIPLFSRNYIYSPVWRPLLLASSRTRTRFLEWTTVGFFMIRPSFCNRAMLRRELAREISLTSFGSNQILRLPHLSTDAARRFWSLRDTVNKCARERDEREKAGRPCKMRSLGRK